VPVHGSVKQITEVRATKRENRPPSRHHRRHGRAHDSLASMASTVVVVKTPNRQPLSLLLEDRLEFGRDCDGVLVPDTRMSRRHVALEPAPDGTVLVTDLGSSNGTTVNGQPVLYPQPVESGDVVRVGNTEITIGRGAHRSTGLATSLGDETSLASSIDVVAEQVASELRPEAVGIRDEPGTLTVAFTDIEGSTDLAVSIGDQAWFEVVREHRQLVTDRAAAMRGRVVQSLGDGFMLCFRSARQALLFAIGLQRALETLAEQKPDRSVRVRVGLHTGEVLVDDVGDLIGQHVVVAARIANLARGGEVLASSLVQQIAEPRGDVAFVAPREVVLKGIKGTHVVYEVDWRAFAG
jgi:class 3 adenylate cyclase